MHTLRTRLTLLAALATLALLAENANAQRPFALKDGETIVFVGDSITQGGDYIGMVEDYLVTRFPDQKFRVINTGLSSETVSGTTEPDHDPPRPCLHDRFDRDVAPLKPDVMIACYGMNDGNYHPFSEERFLKYQAGVRRLIDRAEELGARLIILTPPPYDPYRRKLSDAEVVHYGYKFPAVDYDDVLERYGHWLIGLRGEGYTVGDVGTTMRDHLARQRAKKVSYTLARDGVHPQATGHWLMAQALLQALNAPGRSGECSINAKSLTADKGEVSGLKKLDGGGVAFSWMCPIPMGIDPRVEAEAVQLEEVHDRFNKTLLRVRGLAEGKYDVLVDGKRALRTDAMALGRGVNLTTTKDFPPMKRAAEVYQLISKRRKKISGDWRKSRGIDDPSGAASVDALEKAEQETASQLEEARSLAQPLKIDVEVVPAK
ncbi:GDSL-like Lipase/Acylhydrolase [Planctomycetes bacterium Pan216]|uniref:GDSL-like Lipase/Acylhydrolase n=1 Tax=Kolteria novifilia TaxID=2527975 RepID=A0A518BCX9_9BACT|nr:GDSL-like Lipase/Acylhydrolase [Planctomycetes bacterium Pan216]